MTASEAQEFQIRCRLRRQQREEHRLKTLEKTVKQHEGELKNLRERVRQLEQRPAVHCDVTGFKLSHVTSVLGQIDCQLPKHSTVEFKIERTQTAPGSSAQKRTATEAEIAALAAYQPEHVAKDDLGKLTFDKGYRTLRKFEPVLAGDECSDSSMAMWAYDAVYFWRHALPCEAHGQAGVGDNFHRTWRRRLEQPKPSPIEYIYFTNDSTERFQKGDEWRGLTGFDTMNDWRTYSLGDNYKGFHCEIGSWLRQHHTRQVRRKISNT